MQWNGEGVMQVCEYLVLFYHCSSSCSFECFLVDGRQWLASKASVRPNNSKNVLHGVQLEVDPRLHRPSSIVSSQSHIVHLSQDRRHLRLVIVHVKTCRRELPALQSLYERLLLDDFASSGVDQSSTVFHV